MLGIIIPHYNNITGLEQALNSLTTQTKKTFVVTVVDDCSTIEGVDEVIEKFSDRLHINLIKLPENKGVGNARQVGMDSINEQFLIIYPLQIVMIQYYHNMLKYYIQQQGPVELL